MRMERDVSVKAIIRNFKSGCRALSQMKWVSASGFHLSVAGLLGLAGFVLAIKDGKFGNLSSLQLFPERENRSEDLLLVPGLQNLGNNCFLNVILQALASCSDFRPFLLKAIEESESSPVEEQGENLPLVFALAALLEELCVVGKGRVVLSPRKVMLAMARYIHNFNLASEQDAEEAFLHLLSSLREEFSDCYLPNQGTLAEVFTSSNGRILTPTRSNNWSEHERWQKNFLGPFDGIIGSMLTCRSCSSQISLDFQFFHSLPLSLVLDSGSTIMFGCTLEDCLKQFVDAEQVENYHCSRCWHIAAAKYLSLTGANELKIGTLKRCGGEDSCDCRSIFQLDTLPWSNNFSCTLKQLSIARCPKILCLHVQRVSINVFGEPVKLPGHISFPLILDLFPFMTSGVGIKNSNKSVQREQVKLQYQKPSLHLDHFNMQFESRIRNHVYRSTGKSVYSEAVTADEFGSIAYAEAFLGESNLPQTEDCLKTVNTDAFMQFDDKVSMSCQLLPSENHLYRLVSVVEHFGRAGSGHYTVYRSVRAASHKEDSDDNSEADILRWFCISDSEVCSVSEKEVLAAEASLLFYERVIEG